MIKEVWKDIKGYEGLYQISNYGKVKSLKRKVYAGRNRTRWQHERIMSNNRTNGNGYKIVGLSKNNISENKYIHRLVAEAFLINPNHYYYINHKDENKGNNFVDNLEWCTAKYNITYNELNRRKGFKMINHSSISKKVYQLDENNNIINIFPSIAEASRQFGVSNQAISDCIRGIQKHSAGYKWKYADEDKN